MRALLSVRSRYAFHDIPADSAVREQTEDFIRTVFARRHGAHLRSFCPHLMVLAQHGSAVAAAGRRGAGEERLFLESYLDEPVEAHIARVAGQVVHREQVVEVAHLATERPGAGVKMILTVASHLDALGYQWVVFTATCELLSLFNRLGLPPLALAMADPTRLGEGAHCWGRYYDSRPVVVAGRVRLALERVDRERARA